MKHTLGLAPLIAITALLSCERNSVQAAIGSSGDGRNLLPAPELKEVRVLSQNWSDADARQYYNMTQGSQMMPYVWFLHLEQDSSTALFRDVSNMRALGYLPRSPDQHGNRDGLPVGFAKNGDNVGLTCSACHTAQINYQGTAWLIDGGPTMADAQTMMTKLEAALKATLGNAEKFSRFAAAVLGSPNTDNEKAGLKQELQKLIDKRAGYNSRNLPAPDKPSFGPGRIDAFDAIFNEVAVRFAQSPNAKTQCDAPVSYPFLWDTPQHDHVQWNGSAPNIVIAGVHIGALGRNIGEVLGVFADVDTTNQEFPLGGYASSVHTGNLKDLEELLRGLWSPQWPDAFGNIEASLATKGAALFKEHCVSCHNYLKRDDPHRKVQARMSVVGTDQSMARNVAERESASGIFEGRRLLLPPFRKLRATEQISVLLAHLGQRVLIGSHSIDDQEVVPFSYNVFAEVGEGDSRLSVMLSSLDVENGKLSKARVRSLALLENGKPTVFRPDFNLSGIPKNLAQKFIKVSDDSLESFTSFTADVGPPVPVNYPYKARPLNGIWATAPYLHNGSVLNLDELLKPAKDRKSTFHVGTREFDPKNVGYMDGGDFLFDTKAQPGNSNAGHEYGATVFTPEQRAQLIEYMKSL